MTKLSNFVHKAAIPAILAVALVVPCAAAKPESPAAEGSIAGTVKRPDGAYAVNATVTVKNVDTGKTLETVVDADGEFEFETLPAGAYEVRVTCEGYADFVSDEITVADEELVNLDITLTTLETG